MESEEILKLLGHRIRQMRENLGWSQEELARRCNRHFTYIGRVERGQQNITVEVLNDISQNLSVSIADLFEFQEHPLLLKWKVNANDIIQAVSHGFRAQVDVKGKLAEWMLFRTFSQYKQKGSIKNIEWLDTDGKPDFIIQIGSKTIVVECKNVRSPNTKRKRKPEPIKVELQRTRNSKDGSNTRGYRIDHFNVLSVCLFNRIGSWDFVHVAINNLEKRPEDPNYLKIMQTVSSDSEFPWRTEFFDAVSDLKS